PPHRRQVPRLPHRRRPQRARRRHHLPRRPRPRDPHRAERSGHDRPHHRPGVLTMARRITRKRVAVALCLMLTGVLGTAGTVGYLTFLRSPADPPARVCGDRRASGGPLVVAAGASLTRGTLGADWVGRLRERPEFRGYTFVNSGVNGATTAGLLARTDTDIVRCRPDAVTLLIGTN